jgi:hypothetical protein
MTPQNTQTTPAEQKRYCLILAKPGTGLSVWFYHYASEEAARADIPKWAQHDAYKEYTAHQIAPEPVDRPLLSERYATNRHADGDNV